MLLAVASGSGGYIHRLIEKKGGSVAAIHLVERLGNTWKVQGTVDEWESGYWVVGTVTAQKLVGVKGST